VAAKTTSFTFDVGTHGRVSAALYRAPAPLEATLILAHGAGAPRTHPFMTSIASRVAQRGVDVVTFNFLYAEAGRKMPDRVELLEACWRAAIATVRARGGLPTERLFIGGKSMGGRIATHLAATDDGLVLAGLVLLGYPLHPMGKPKAVREEILKVKLPMLVIQGSRDSLGTAAEMQRVLQPLGRSRVKAIEGGDHSFEVSRSKTREAIEERERIHEDVASVIADFIRSPKRRPRVPARKL
jgi:predicted alpha/beta-hydrolase family hydrolase